MADGTTVKSGLFTSKTNLVLLVAGLVGICAFFWKLDDVFPSASIDLRLSRRSVVEQSREILKQIGSWRDDYIESTTFASREYAQLFIEHEYDAARAKELMRSELPIWYWSSRFCKELELEEIKVGLTPDGKLTWMSHALEAERALPAVSHEEALKISTVFVEKFAGRQLADTRDGKGSDIKLIEDGMVKQSRRMDHYFTWEDQSVDYKGGRLRTYVYVSGNRVTEFNHYLHVPDSFDHRYKHIRSYNDLLTSIAQVLFAVLIGALLFTFVWALSAHRVRWRLALIFGGLAFLQSALGTLNNWPVIIKAYDTSKTLQAYLTDTAIGAGVQSLLAAGSAVVLIGGVEALYRLAFPEKLAAESFLKPVALRTKQLLEATYVGLCAFGIQLGWITLFYAVGDRLGVWSPLQLREVAVLSSAVPAYSSFSMAAEASVFEELLCRILCLMLVQRLTGNFWVANLVQATGWAFMHSNYPQEPAYVRGLELTFVGFFFGLLVRRYGILPSVISHFTYNCLLGVLPLLSLSTPLLFASALIAVCPGFLWFALSVAKVRAPGPVEEAPLLNSAVGPPPAGHGTLEDRQQDYAYSGMTSKTRLATVMAGLTALSLNLIPARQIGDDARLRLNRQEAVDAAGGYLLSRGISPENWLSAAYLAENMDAEEIQYGQEKEGAKVAQIVRQSRYPFIWYVKFFKPAQYEKYEVMLNPSGVPIGLDIILEDDAAGATLSEEEARKLVEQFIASERSEFLPLRFSSHSITKRSNRVDHNFIYDSPRFKMGDAALRINIDVVGSTVDRLYLNWDIPDSWRFERQKKTLKDQILKYAGWTVALGMLICMIIWLVGLLRSQSIRWRPGLIVAALYALLVSAQFVNDIPGLPYGYDTDVSLSSFWTETVMDKLKSFFMSGSVLAFLAVISFAAFRLLRPADSLMAYFRKCFKPVTEQEHAFAKTAWTDALLFGYSAAAITCGIDRLAEIARAAFSPSAQIASFGTLSEASTRFSPAAGIFLQAITLSLIAVLLVPVCAGVFARFFRSWPFFAGFVILVALINYGSNRYWQDHLIDASAFTATCLVFYFFIRRLAGTNVLSYIVFSYVSIMAGRVAELAKYAWQAYLTDVAIATLMILMPLFIGLFQISARLRGSR